MMALSESKSDLGQHPDLAHSNIEYLAQIVTMIWHRHGSQIWPITAQLDMPAGLLKLLHPHNLSHAQCAQHKEHWTDASRSTPKPNTPCTQTPTLHKEPHHTETLKPQLQHTAKTQGTAPQTMHTKAGTNTTEQHQNKQELVVAAPKQAPLPLFKLFSTHSDHTRVLATQKQTPQSTRPGHKHTNQHCPTTQSHPRPHPLRLLQLPFLTRPC